MTKCPRVVHPFLVALFPTLFLYSRNLGAVDVSSLWIPIGLSLGLTLAAWGILRLCRLDAARAGMIISVGLTLFFSFGHGVRLTSRLGLARDRAVQERIALGAEVVALASVVGLVVRKPGIARSLNSGANVASIALIGLTMAGVVCQAWGHSRDRPPRIARPISTEVHPSTGYLPDVYFLVLDAYGRSDVLKDLYGFDNGPFLERLEQKGFAIARKSRANYCQTALSLAATLNVRYLDDLGGNASSNRLPLKRLIADNAVFEAFRAAGYRLVTFASGFDATEGLEADLTIAPSSNLQTFHALVADQTPLWLLLGRKSTHDPHQMHRDRILKVFDELPAASHASGSPTFTFAHVLAPHPPFVFGAEGEDLSGVEGSYSLNDCEGWSLIKGHGGPEDYARRYREQVEYITRRLEETIDRILTTSTRPPIIIVQGDHGPGSHFNMGLERPNDLRERMGILNACLVPESVRPRITDTISPINTWRVVLDACLGSKLELLEERSNYSTYLTPYLFIDVTGVE